MIPGADYMITHWVLDKMVYAYSNQVAADLVDKAEDWPGVSSFEPP